MAKNGTASRTAIVVAIIAFLGTIGAAVIGTKFWESDSGKPQGGADLPEPPAATASTPDASTSTMASRLLWRGEVKFPDNSGLDLADDEPRTRPESEAREFVINTGSFAGNPVPVFYHWRGQAGKVEKPSATLSDCREALTSQQGPIYGRVNDSVCFQSQDGTRLAAVSVRGWDNNYWATKVQVWQLRLR